MYGWCLWVVSVLDCFCVAFAVILVGLFGNMCGWCESFGGAFWLWMCCIWCWLDDLVVCVYLGLPFGWCGVGEWCLGLVGCLCVILWVVEFLIVRWCRRNIGLFGGRGCTCWCWLGGLIAGWLVWWCIWVLGFEMRVAGLMVSLVAWVVWFWWIGIIQPFLGVCGF